MYTTLNKIRAHSPCSSGWNNLLKYLGKTKADDAPLSLLTILNSNGLEDTLWCFRAVDGFQKEQRLFAVWCARQVQHLKTDARSIAALDVAERYANGCATEAELAAAWDAAQAAARAAAWNAAWTAAWTAARDAARAAAWTAAWTAARDAAQAAARAAAWNATQAAAQAAAWDAAWNAAQDAQEKQLRKVLLAIN